MCKNWVRVGVCVLTVSVLDSRSIIPFTLRQFDFAHPMAYISMCVLISVYNINIVVFFSAFLLISSAAVFIFLEVSTQTYIMHTFIWRYVTNETPRKVQATRATTTKNHIEKKEKIENILYVWYTFNVFRLYRAYIFVYMPLGMLIILGY